MKAKQEVVDYVNIGGPSTANSTHRQSFKVV